MVETQGIELFMEDLKRTCKQHKVKLVLGNHKSVSLGGGWRGAGYFDHYSRVLAVSRGKEDWLGTLVHESCHLDQWIEKSELWSKWMKEGLEMVERYFKNPSLRGAHRGLMNEIRLELDTEKRAVEKIKEYNLPINLSSYIQKANCYILIYHRYWENKEWSNKDFPPQLVGRMPDRFMNDQWYKMLNKRTIKLFLDNGF